MYIYTYIYNETLRKHGLSTEQFPVSAYIGCSKNLKDLKERDKPAFS